MAQDDAYYSAISASDTNLVNNLKTRIRNPYTKVTYDNYDETNVANFSSYSNGNGTRSVVCVYSSYVYTYTPPFTWSVFSREHTWCHSWMPSYPSESGQEYADQYHLFPTHQNGANGPRSNHPLGIVTTLTSTQFGDCKLGKNAAGQTVFEPRPQHKGDAARALLYMSVKYDGVGSANWTFNWLNNTRLPSISEAPMDVNLLLQWHRDDPPDKWEVERNNYIQSIQQNRNPFVDHPELVNYINFNDLTYVSQSYSTEPTNYVTGLSAAQSGTSVVLTWTGAAAGSQAPSGYLIEAYDANNYFVPIDGSAYTDDSNLSDGAAKVNVASTAGDTYTFSGLAAGKTYYFRVYSYNGSGATVNYKITGAVPSVSVKLSASALATQPTAQPTNLQFSSVKTTTMNLAYAAASPASDAYIVLMKPGSAPAAVPVDGTAYTAGTTLGDATILYSGPAVSFSASGLSAATTYYFAVYSYNGSGSSCNYLITGPLSGSVSTMPLGVEENETGKPAEFMLRQNYPNPFNPSTVIECDMPGSGNLSLVVYDILGREIAVLARGWEEAGSHKFSFDAAGLTGGVYVCRMDCGGYSKTQKLVYLK